MNLTEPATFAQQFEDSIRAAMSTPEFIRKNELWKGFFENKGMMIFSAFIAILFSVALFDSLVDFFSSGSVDLDQPSSSSDRQVLEAGVVTDTLRDDSKKALNMGGSRFFLLVLLEVVIFSFCTKALNILRVRDVKPIFKDFVRAEKRMILVMAESALKSFVVMLLLSIGLGIIGFEVLKTPLMFMVYSYFLAYGFFDNYNEQFGYTRKQSGVIIKEHMGAALGLGLLINVGLYVPLIGPFLVPFLAAIAATLYADRVKMEEVTAGVLVEKVK